MLFRVRSRRAAAAASAAAIVLGLAAIAAVAGRSTPDVPTAEITKGDFTEFLELRGDIRPVRSVVLTAPMQSGELQIVRLARTGSVVKAGDVVVEFDGTTLRRTVQEKQSELKQADAEIEQGLAQARITAEQDQTGLMKAKYDVQRAKLDLGNEELMAKLDYEKAKLALADAEQRLKEAEAKARSDRAAADADALSRRRKREKVAADLARAERALAALQLKAPVGGTASVMPNFRAGGPFGGEQEFREGDRAWSGAAIVELPDLSSVHVAARLDEADRSRIQPGQPATVRVDAVPDKEFSGKVADISVLARVDFSSGWPPPRNFDLKIALVESGSSRTLQPDQRLRPGMSANARVAVGRVPNVLLAPAEAVFTVNGRPTVYKLKGTSFEPQQVEVARRSREQVALASGVEPGDRIALRNPEAAGGTGK
jgi:multidrug efflux pump subunit AcrA (membrane-fusion protein)